MRGILALKDGDACLRSFDTYIAVARIVSIPTVLLVFRVPEHNLGAVEIVKLQSGGDENDV